MKIAANGIGDSFLEYSLIQANIFARRIVLIHFSLQIKQKVYSIHTYSVHELTQVLVKMYRKMAKSNKFLKVFHFSIHQRFPDTKSSVVREMAVVYIRQKRGKHQFAKLASHDRE